MESIEIKSVLTPRQKKAFINLPWTIYENDPFWVPQLKLALKDMLNPRHPFYKTAETECFLAYKNREIVGRVMAINPKRYNNFHHCHVGFFGFYECIKDENVSHKLLQRASTWCQERNLEDILGPFNPSTNYESGLLVDGFSDPPQLMMTYNPPYYEKYLKNFGFQKEMDLLAYNRDAPFNLPEVITKMALRAQSRNKISYRQIRKENFKEEVQLLLEIYNNAWESNWGFVPYTPEEFHYMAKDLKMIVDERLLIFAEVEGQPAGFAAALPDLNQVLKNIPNGQLFPTGLFKLLTYKKRVNRLRVPLLGVKKEFRKIGLDTLLYKELFTRAQEQGYKKAEASWILEDNLNMNKALLKMGFSPYKTYRIFKKKI